MGLSRRPKGIFGLALLLSTLALLAGCATSPQSPFNTAGPVARDQLSLLKLTLWLAIGIGAVVALALLYVVFRFRSKGEEKSVPKQIHGSAKLEIAWTIIPIVILAIVAVPTVQTAFSTQTPLDNPDLTIKAIGHQWWFEFEYPNQKVVTANELYIPSGKKVRVDIESKDVIHSFWVPNLAGKTDMIPGRINTMWFQADEPGYFYGQCAELCGTAHARMRFRVVAVSPDEFDQWIKTRQAGAVEPTDANAIAGKALFEGKGGPKANCLTCHSIDGTAAKGKVGPNLTNIGARTSIGAGMFDATEENLKKWIRDPKAMKPGVTMPAHPNLSDKELGQIVKYLKSLKTEQENTLISKYFKDLGK